jgi:hypothetical protein
MRKEDSMKQSEMIRIKTFLSEPDARIASAYLESQGITTLIKKDDAEGNYPSLQVSNGVRLFVNAADEQAALALLNEIESDQASKQVPDSKTNKKSATMLIVFLLLGIALGFFLSSVVREYRSASKHVIKVDTINDNKPDVYYYYENKHLVRVEADRNYDGIIDAWYYYNNGKLLSSESDDNFDGKVDAWAKYENENNFELEIDTDFNGTPDATIYFANRLKARIDWHPNGSKIIVKREIFENGTKKYDLIDTHKRGIFDMKVSFDAFGNEVGRKKLP